MSIYYYDIVAPREAEEVLNYTIDGGESLVLYGADDFGQILSWINLADLALEFIPSCRESLHTCIDWFGSNRERVEVGLSILRDARAKVHNPLYFGLYQPTTEYQMLIERVCSRRAASGSQYYPSEARSLSGTRTSLEEQQ
ncbi:MAG: hypothetical protein ACLP5H_22960 [Desulfomonilaceae bacterium]